MLVTVLATLTFQERTVNTVWTIGMNLLGNIYSAETDLRWTQVDKMTYDTKLNSVMQQAVILCKPGCGNSLDCCKSVEAVPK